MAINAPVKTRGPKSDTALIHRARSARASIGIQMIRRRAANASHFICCRVVPLVLLNRTMSEVAAVAPMMMIPRPKPLARMSPSGDRTSRSGLGRTASAASPPQPPFVSGARTASAPVIHNAGTIQRHRGEGSVSSGKKTREETNRGIPSVSAEKANASSSPETSALPCWKTR
jgi:hypothetical protein